jgi:hypothetical protein
MYQVRLAIQFLSPKGNKYTSQIFVHMVVMQSVNCLERLPTLHYRVTYVYITLMLLCFMLTVTYYPLQLLLLL